MISQLTQDTLTALCPTCQCSTGIAVSSLQLGAAGAGVSKDVIMLPPCDCGSQTYLFRTWDTTPEEHLGTPHDLQRRAVNTLAQYLISQGKSHPDHAATHAGETEDPPDLADLPIKVR